MTCLLINKHIKNLKNMNILVTGCNGQLGNEVQTLAKTHTQHNYTFTDVVIPEGTNVKRLDITNEQEVDKFLVFLNYLMIVKMRKK